MNTIVQTFTHILVNRPIVNAEYNILPFIDIRKIMRRRRKAYMQRLIQFVSRQWHAQKWHKTLLAERQDQELGIQFIYYYLLKPNRWRPGSIMSALNPQGGQSSYSLSEPNRIMEGIMSFRFSDHLINSNSLEVMLSAAYVLGVIAFWEMAPLVLLEVDPTLILQPEKVQILRKVVLHQGCQPLDVLDGRICTCTENISNNLIGEDFQQRSMGVAEEIRAKGAVKALAIAMGAAIMVMMLNAVTTANITG